jgi:oligopeptidase B
MTAGSHENQKGVWIMSRLKNIGGISATLCVGILIVVSVYSCTGPAPEPPVAKVEPKTDTVHGNVRVDDYFWLRDKESQEVIAYLEAENAYTDSVMNHTIDFQEKLFEEMKGRIKETDLSVPIKDDSFYYYSRTEEGKQYRVYCRKKGSEEAEEEVLADQNQLAEGYEYFRMGAFAISPDHRLLAYAVDTTGGELYTIYIKDLESGQLLSDQIDATDGQATWAADNKTLFYTTLDAIKRPDKLWRHTLGSTQALDVLVYHEKDESYSVYPGKSLSEKFLFLGLYANNSTEMRYLSADNPTGKFRILQPRQPEIEYSVRHHEDDFYILTNEDAQNFKVLKTSIRGPDRRVWKTVIEHRDSVLIERVSMFKNYMIVMERENGLRNLKITDMNTKKSHYVKFPEPIYMVYTTGNAEYDTEILRFTYFSLVTPRSVFDYHMNTRERELKKQYEVLGGYNPEEYASERIFAEAPDGVKIPISMVYKKGMVKDGSNPLYLYGYGSYGASMDPYFSSNRLSLLDRGFIYAIAHVRGGSEMGRWWYEDGRLLNKMNTFSDFIACAEHVIAEKYTSARNMTMSGGSAGGLLVGAVVNMRPDLFNIVIADVPFVDVINTMLDPTIPLTVNEYTEWGNPEEKEYFDYMLKYSPYDNVEAKNYPHMLVTAGLNDPRVQYWEPAKWTAKLRTTKTDNNRLILKTNMGAGHGGASGRYDYLKEIALEYAFILDLMDLAK